MLQATLVWANSDNGLEKGSKYQEACRSVRLARQIWIKLRKVLLSFQFRWIGLSLEVPVPYNVDMLFSLQKQLSRSFPLVVGIYLVAIG